MLDYSTGKIYIIKNPKIDGVYIGSTTKTLGVRFSQHKYDYKRSKSGQTNYRTSSKMFEIGTPIIELLFEYPCKNRTELTIYEGEIIQSMPNCVNKIIAGRTPKQYYECNRPSILQRQNAYNKINKVRINQLKRILYAKRKALNTAV